VARVGPIARQSRTIHEMLVDPARTGVIAVTTPDEMPVSEALYLQRALPEQMGIDIERVVVNAMQPRRFSARDAEKLREAMPRPAPGRSRGTQDAQAAQIASALEAALSQHGRSAEQRRQLDRLRRRTGTPPVILPFLFTPAIERVHLEALADRLAEAL
jgi:hypothetical protein